MLKRTLQLLGQSTAQAGKNYFSDVTGMVSDTKAMLTEMKDVAVKPFEFIRKLTSTGGGGGLYKYVNDWFYQRTSEFDPLSASDDDDFDSGMKLEAGSGTSEQPSATLDTKSMKDIARGQVGAMYQIGQKQVQAGLANTAEIVTNFNSRSAEIITAINNINKSIMNIDQNIAKLVAGSNQEQSRYRENDDAINLFNGGKLTLGSTYEAIKKTGSENTYFMMLKDALEGIKSGPQFFTDKLIDKLTNKITIDGKSIQEHAEDINTVAGNLINDAMRALIRSSPMKFFFGDDLMGYLNNDFSRQVKYDYNKSKAVFDSMTRRTIIDIIPDYLRKITTALTGETWYIDKQKGTLTQQNVDVVAATMSRHLTRSKFSNQAVSDMLDSDDFKSGGKYSNVPKYFINQCLKWISNGFIFAMSREAAMGEYKLSITFREMMDDNNEIRKAAFQSAYNQFKSVYGDNEPDWIKGKFQQFCVLLVERLTYDKKLQDEFRDNIVSGVHELNGEAINLVNSGYDVDIIDTNNARLTAAGSYGDVRYDQTYSAEVEKTINDELAKTKKDGKFDETAAKRVLETLGMSKDNITQYINTNATSKNQHGKHLTEKQANDLIEQLVQEKKRDERLKAGETRSTVETKDTFYAGGKKHNIGSLIYDIKNILENGILRVKVISGAEKKAFEKKRRAAYNLSKDNLSEDDIKKYTKELEDAETALKGFGGIPSKLNLNVHGCGPIALTDLANRMYMNGKYDPNNGTSVGDYITTASSMGMDLHPGKVTREALKQTSPTESVTVLGSGYGFGTEPGQNHYMNITGYDDGYVYTSNPMYGNGRFPIGSIANNSILGLFGKGDDKSTEQTIHDLVNGTSQNLHDLINDTDADTLHGKLLRILSTELDSRKVTKNTNEKVTEVSEKYNTGKKKAKGIGNAISDYLTYKKKAISSDAHDMLDAAVHNANVRADAVKEGSEYKKKITASFDDGSTNYSEHDKQLASQALSMMQGALLDGNGKNDLDPIKKVISKIKNRDLRTSLQENITGLIQRSESKKVEATPKTKIGKFILFGFGLLKKFLSPVFRGAKLILSGIWGGIKGTFSFMKNNGARILKFLVAPYIKGAAKVKYGVKGLAQGLFGWTEKDSAGNVVDRTKGLIPVLLTPFKIVTKPITLALKGILAGVKKIPGLIGGLFKGIGGFVKFSVQSFKNVFGSLGNKLKNSKLGQWFANRKKRTPLTEFGKGFKYGWSGVKNEAKEKAASKIARIERFDPANKNNPPQTLTDQNTTTIAGLMNTIVAILRGQDPDAKKNEEEKKKKDEAEEKQKEQQEETKNRAETGNGDSEEEKKKQDEQTQTQENKENSPKEDTQNTGGDTSSNDQQSQNQQGDQSGGDTSSTQNNNNQSGGDTSSSQNNNNQTGSNDSSSGGSDTSSGGDSGNGNDQSNQNQNQQQQGDSGGGAGGGKKSGLFKIGNVLGKIAGGITSIYGGIFKLVVTAAMQLSGFKTLMKLFKDVVKTAVKPLNKLFKQVVTALKPIMKTLTGALTELVESAVQIISVLLDTLTPFLEPLFNVVTEIMGSIGDVLVDAIVGIVKLLNPIVDKFLNILIPVIQGIHGILETVVGALMYGLGNVIYGVGWLVSNINLDKAQKAAGNLMQTGNNMIMSGTDKIHTGMARTIDAVATAFERDSITVTYDNSNSTETTVNNDDMVVNNNTIYNGYNKEIARKYGVELNPLTTDEQISAQYGDEVLKELKAPRDSNGNIINENETGSGDTKPQASYGTFLNMKDHGCGPIALAENINRRNTNGLYGSGDIDPRALTISMYNAGTYDKNRGTSIGNYINTSRALGYDMVPGGVDYRSLKQASPNKPITLIGSGSGFGTKQGNNHYINVVGTDNSGFAYVSNPLTGKISKSSISDLTLHSKLGLYGSGDDDDKTLEGDKTWVDKLDEKAPVVSKVLEYSPFILGLIYKYKKAKSEYQKYTNAQLREKFEDEAPEIKELPIEQQNRLFQIMKEEDPFKRNVYVEQYIKDYVKNQEQAEEFRAAVNGQTTKEVKLNNGSTDSATSQLGDDVSNIDFSAEAIADKYGTSTTISTLITGLKDLASNFLSIFNFDDTSTEEGKKKYLKRLKKELGDDTYNALRAYAFLQFFNQYPPSIAESLVPGSFGGRTYAARFKLHEYDYIRKYHDTIVHAADPSALFQAAGVSTLVAASGNRIQSVNQIAEFIDSLDSGASALIGVTTNPSNADYNNTTYQEGWQVAKALNFKPRLEVPEDGNIYYNTKSNGGKNPHIAGNPQAKGKNILWNCSGYVLGRFHEMINDPTFSHLRTGAKNGGEWLQPGGAAVIEGLPIDRKIEHPRPGDMISWTKDKEYGHVAMIEEVPDNDTIVISQSGYRTTPGSGFLFNTKTLKRSNNWAIPGWSDAYHIYGIAHNPYIDYEIANNGSAVNSRVGYGKKIEYTPKMKQYMDNNGDQFAYNWTYNDTNANLFDKSNYHKAAIDAGLTSAEEAYVAGVGIMENGAGKLIGKQDITLVGYDALGSKLTGEHVNDFGVSNWRSNKKQGEHDYSFGSTLAEQLKHGFKENYFGPNPTGEKRAHAKVLNSNYTGHYNKKGKWLTGYKNLLPGVIGHPMKLGVGDLWGNYLNTDMVEATGHGFANAQHGAGWNDERGHARYIGATIGYWNYMVDKGLIRPQANGINYATDPKFQATGSGDTSSVYVPPIDSSKLLSDSIVNNQDTSHQTNNYYIAKDSNEERREELNILLNHTFNVRSESMEAILTEMLTELKKRGNNRTPVAVPSPTTTPSLFNDEIPPQIERLMNGTN